MFIFLWELPPTMFIPPHKIFHATVTVMVIKIKHYLNYYYTCDWGTNVTTQGFTGALLRHIHAAHAICMNT
jgi:hypothetical protein